MNSKIISSKKIGVGVLAGGKSSRMGQNKALMQLNNETMIGRILKKFDGFGEILVSAAKKGLYEAEGLKVVYDVADSIGPIEGIRQILTHSECEYVFICAADMPFVGPEIAEYLAEFISSDYDCYVVEDDERIHPLCAIYSKSILPVVEKLISEGRYRLLDILNSVRTKYVSLKHTDFDKKIVRNVNTKDEFLELSRPYVFAVSGYHNSGKTYLIEKLINEFIQDGCKVAVLKHDGRDHITDAEGTDTYRYRKSGAVCTVIVSDSRCILDADCVLDPDDILGQIKRLPDPPDVIILEGFKDKKIPRIEVVRKEVHPFSVTDPDHLICIASDHISPEETKCPVYGPDDVRGIFLCLKEYFGIPND